MKPFRIPAFLASLLLAGSALLAAPPAGVPMLPPLPQEKQPAIDEALATAFSGRVPAPMPGRLDWFTVRQPVAPKLAADEPQYGKGLVVPKDLKNRIAKSWQRHGVRLAALPRATEADYDLRALGLVPPIKDQGNCGSCWDFSGVAAAEGAFIKAGKGTASNTNWSEQSVLDCGNNGGCNGDWPATTLEMLKNSGVANTSDYPYQARAGQCKNVPHPNTIDDWGYVGSDTKVPSVQAIKDAMKAYGVISVAVAADNAWAGYKSGVFKDSGSRQIDHAISLVGWHDDPALPKGGYWIARNQWGKSWGESGYMRCEYGSNLIGYGAAWAHVNAGPLPPVPPVPPVPPIPPSPTTLGAVTADPATGIITFVGPWKVKGGVVPSLAAELADAGVNEAMIGIIQNLIEQAKKK